MDKQPTYLPVCIFRGIRLALHLLYGVLIAVIYPHLNHAKQCLSLKTWSRQLLNILNVGIQVEGQQPVHGTSGCLIVANHVSWLDIFALNAIYPTRFIAKAEIRSWPIIGWLCNRSGTIFIERAMRQNTSMINQRVGVLLKQGVCIGLFPEGTTTDGKQVGHFHSSLIQPAIDTGIKLCPIALHYQSNNSAPENPAVFIGEMALAQSIWKILRCPHLNALLAFTPILQPTNRNRRELARAAQQAIDQALQTIARKPATPNTGFTSPESMLSSRSSYALLIDPLLSPHQK